MWLGRSIRLSRSPITQWLLWLCCVWSTTAFINVSVLYAKTTCKSISTHNKKIVAWKSVIYIKCAALLLLSLLLLLLLYLLLLLLFFVFILLLKMYAHADETDDVWNSRMRDTKSDLIKWRKKTTKIDTGFSFVWQKPDFHVIAIHSVFSLLVPSHSHTYSLSRLFKVPLESRM